MAISSINSKGQVTAPGALREKLSFSPVIWRKPQKTYN